MVIRPSYYDACDVIYYVIAVRARRMVRIFFLPYLGNRSKSDPCSYELFCLESHILSFPKVLQIPPESPCIFSKNAQKSNFMKIRPVGAQSFNTDRQMKGRRDEGRTDTFEEFNSCFSQSDLRYQ